MKKGKVLTVKVRLRSISNDSRGGTRALFWSKLYYCISPQKKSVISPKFLLLLSFHRQMLEESISLIWKPVIVKCDEKTDLKSTWLKIPTRPNVL